MGQQQLLLVILVTIIVGIATVVAINIFGTAAEEANKDAIRQDLVAASAQVQGIWARPEMMGGVGGDFTTNPPNDESFLRRLGIPGSVSGSDVENENAIYTLDSRGADQVVISAAPKGSTGDWTMTVQRQTSGNWLVTINDGDGQEVTIGTEDTTT